MMAAVEYPNISAALGKAFSHASEVAEIEIVDGIYIMKFDFVTARFTLLTADLLCI